MVRDLEREDFIHESFGNVIPSRIDAEACSIREELDKLMTLQQPLSGSCNNSSETAKDATVEHLKAALVEIQLCSRLESLLLKKKSLNNGDSPELHTEKHITESQNQVVITDRIWATTPFFNQPTELLKPQRC
ncbi:uncharacterized protein LOC112180214 isoform X2 [Rosa chinensis]|uniref:uncharacterized protein LOC112180214 isoform X2 n=1 Tax=Rosa chinensis TaxID=74649 RepID=UPI001AD93EC9|nr:uncharacterized protein LOC112180214 isoform X2 [Rosa chinensis]